MTVSDAFRQALDALLKARGWKGIDVTAATGLSSATITKLRNGERGASFEVLERLREALGVTPAELFDPDAALSRIGLARRPADMVGGQTLDSAHTAQVGSASPGSSEGGSSLLKHPDSELLAALLAYWDDCSPEARLELVGHGMRLRKAAPPAATVGFMRG